MERSDKVMFRCTHLQTTAYAAFKDMRRQGEFCDVNFTFEHRKVSVHRNIVAASIPFFREQFNKHDRCDVTVDIAVKDIEPCVLESLIDFCYTQEIEITTAKVRSLLSASCSLGIEVVRDACLSFLATKLCAASAIGIWKIADRFNCLKLKNKVDSFICENFDDFVDKGNFVTAPLSYIKTLTSRDDLRASSEEKVFEFVMKWVKGQVEERKHYLPEILPNVRVKLLSPHYLAEKVAQEQLIKSSPACSYFIHETRYLHLSSRKKTDTTRTGIRSKIFIGNASPNPFLSGIYLIYEMLISSMYCLTATRHERISDVVSQAETDVGVVVAVNGKFCIIHPFYVREYDTSNGTWVIKPFRGMNRFGYRVAGLNNLIYVCGGVKDNVPLDVVECIDSERGYQVSTVNCMYQSRSWCGVVALEGFIYAVGGYGPKDIFDTMERYNPNTGVWHMMASMLTKRFDFGCATLKRKIYVCGGRELAGVPICLSSAEVYDPEENQWKFISFLKYPRRKFSLISYSGKLYAFEGIDFESNYTGTEVYDPEDDKWSDGVPTNKKLSVIGAIVLPVSN